MLIDLHTHTRPRSDDSDLDPEQLIQEAKAAGLDGICFTEHDWHWNARDVKALCDEHNFVVFRGMEISSDEGHLLVFGLSEYKFGMHHAQFVRRLLDEVGGVMILAHPFRRQVHYNPNPEQLFDSLPANNIFNLVDAIETLNGRSTDKENDFAESIGRRFHLKGVGGSDAHSLSDIPSCVTEFQTEITTLQQLTHELKEGRFKPVDLRDGTD